MKPELWLGAALGSLLTIACGGSAPMMASESEDPPPGASQALLPGQWWVGTFACEGSLGAFLIGGRNGCRGPEPFAIRIDGPDAALLETFEEPPLAVRLTGSTAADGTMTLKGTAVLDILRRDVQVTVRSSGAGLSGLIDYTDVKGTFWLHRGEILSAQLWPLASPVPWSGSWHGIKSVMSCTGDCQLAQRAPVSVTIGASSAGLTATLDGRPLSGATTGIAATFSGQQRAPQCRPQSYADVECFRDMQLTIEQTKSGELVGTLREEVEWIPEKASRPLRWTVVWMLIDVSQWP